MGKQRELSLAYDRREQNAREGHALRLALIEVAHRAEKQGLVMAAELGVDPGQFSRALYGRGTYYDIAWVPALIRADSERLILSKAASFVGCEVQPKRELTPEDVVERFGRACRDSGALGAQFYRLVYGEEIP